MEVNAPSDDCKYMPVTALLLKLAVARGRSLHKYAYIHIDGLDDVTAALAD